MPRSSPRRGTESGQCACSVDSGMSRISANGRRGVAGSLPADSGLVPTRTMAWGSWVRPIRPRMTARLRGTSVKWVRGHVANPASVHSSRTVDSTSPQRTSSSGVSPSVDSTRTADRSVVISVRRGAPVLAGYWRPMATRCRSSSETRASRGYRLWRWYVPVGNRTSAWEESLVPDIAASDPITPGDCETFAPGQDE